MLWGLPVVATEVAAFIGKFLTGAFQTGAQLFDREDANVVISTENADDFEKNLISIRCEERAALAVKRPEAFILEAFMKLKTLKPLYLGGQTLVEGTPFETIEQHGRQLIQKGYAELDESDDEVVVTISRKTLLARGADFIESQRSNSATRRFWCSRSSQPQARGAWQMDFVEDEKQVGHFVGNKAEAQELDRLAAQVKPERSRPCQ